MHWQWVQQLALVVFRFLNEVNDPQWRNGPRKTLQLFVIKQI